jgi:hypothetical protein
VLIGFDTVSKNHRYLVLHQDRPSLPPPLRRNLPITLTKLVAYRGWQYGTRAAICTGHHCSFAQGGIGRFLLRNFWHTEAGNGKRADIYVFSRLAMPPSVMIRSQV